MVGHGRTPIIEDYTTHCCILVPTHTQTRVQVTAVRKPKASHMVRTANSRLRRQAQRIHHGQRKAQAAGTGKAQVVQARPNVEEIQGFLLGNKAEAQTRTCVLDLSVCKCSICWEFVETCASLTFVISSVHIRVCFLIALSTIVQPSCNGSHTPKPTTRQMSDCGKLPLL